MTKRHIIPTIAAFSLLLMSLTGMQGEQQPFTFAGIFPLAGAEEATEPVEDLPVAEVVDLPLPQLRDLHDAKLADQLNDKLNTNPKWRNLLRQNRMAVGVVDLSASEGARFATLNGRHMMYAASLPKIAVLAAAHDAIERGDLQETTEVKKDMRLMIAKSNNAATTRMIDRVGFENIERTMTDPDLKLYDPEFGGGLWVGKRYAAGGRRYPDPIKGISHAATAEQICRYFYLLANDALISPEASDKMRDYLVDPELHHKFVSVLDRVAPQAKVYRKSGSWSTFHADVAMVHGPERNYIITALVDDPDGEQICRNLAKVLDELLTE